MKNSDESLEYVKDSVKLFEENEERIDFLEKYLRDNRRIPLETLAFIYESLGDLHSHSGKPKGNFYSKAASTWEMISVLRRDVKVSGHKRRALSFALSNYRKALSSYKKAGHIYGTEEARSRIKEVSGELRRYGSPVKTVVIGMVMVSFVLSFFFLSPRLTGYVATVETGEASIAGFVLVILGVLGVFLVLRKWR